MLINPLFKGYKKNKANHQTAFKPTLNKLHTTNKMKDKKIMAQKKIALSFFKKHGAKKSVEMIALLRTRRIIKLMNLVQHRYQKIKNYVLRQKPNKEPYEDEICLFVLSHGSDEHFVRENIQVRDQPEELFENVRIFGLKNTNENYPAKIIIETDSHTQRIYHDYEKIIVSLLSDEAFSYSMKDRERLIESTLKLTYSNLSKDDLQYIQSESGLRNFINPPIENFRPVLDHIWAFDDDDTMKNATYPTGTFLVMKSTKKEDIPYTCGGYQNDIKSLENQLFRGKYWNNKLDLKPDTNVLLSDLIRSLKNKGYKHIHIIDISCRYNPEEFYHNKNVMNVLKYLQHRKNDYDKKGGSAAKEQELPHLKNNLQTLLKNDIESTQPLSHSYMYQIYKKIIPETNPDEPNRLKALYTWYFMILLGYYTEIYERDYGVIIAIKGGRSIQLLINGNYKSDDLDIKIISVPEGKTKKEFAQKLSQDLVQGLTNISVKEPNVKEPNSSSIENDFIYKISLSIDRRYTPLVDIDFKELDCSKGEHSIECRLKNILTHVEPTTVFIDGFDFIENTNLNYNTYPIEIQIIEKMELIKEYKENLKTVVNNFFEMKKDSEVNSLVDFLISLPKYPGHMNSELYNAIQKYSNNDIVKRDKISSFLGSKYSELFYLHKFKHSLEGLQQMNRKDIENERRRVEEETRAAKEHLKRRKELFNKISKNIKIAASIKKEAIKQAEEEFKRAEERRRYLAIRMGRAIISAAREQRERNEFRTTRKAAKKERIAIQRQEEQRQRQEAIQRQEEEERLRKMYLEQQKSRLKEGIELLNALGMNPETTKNLNRRLSAVSYLKTPSVTKSKTKKKI